MKREMGRRLALWGSAASIVAHMIGALIGFVGGHGLLHGVGFPVAIVLLLRATPSSGPPIDTQNTDALTTESHDRGVLRAAPCSPLRSLARSWTALRPLRRMVVDSIPGIARSQRHTSMRNRKRASSFSVSPTSYAGCELELKVPSCLCLQSTARQFVP